MFSLFKKIVIGFSWFGLISFGYIANAEANMHLVAANTVRQNPNQTIVSPGVIFPTNYNAPIPEAKPPFVPEIEDKTDTSSKAKSKPKKSDADSP